MYRNNATGLLLVAKNWAYADEQGKVDWGPKSDKMWLRKMVKDKVCFCGPKTYLTLPDSLVFLTRKLYVHSMPYDCEIHLGGPKTLYTHPPKKLIIHQTDFDVKGPRFLVPAYYKEVFRVNLQDYTEIVYENTCYG